jgi:glyoxylase-like metal-dependent hydrolase (beta-lactamase superfamily II)
MNGRWLELADGVFARRYRELDLTVGLVIGADGALVIDTRGDARQGAEWARAVRTVTALPLTVLLTHAHFDHCFGASALVSSGTRVYAQRGCPGALRATAEPQRAEWSAYYRRRGCSATAEAVHTARVVLPNHLVDRDAELDLGGRTVRLHHPGAAHTDHDLAAYVAETGTLFAGDLVEQGAPPDFGDADPLGWPAALDALLALNPVTVVPGHGEPVSPGFVSAQRDELAAVAALCRAVGSGTLDQADAIAASPYPADTTRAALARHGCA